MQTSPHTVAGQMLTRLMVGELLFDLRQRERFTSARAALEFSE